MKYVNNIEIKEKFNRAFYLLNSSKIEVGITDFFSSFSSNPEKWNNPQFEYQAKRQSHYDEALELLIELYEIYPEKEITYLLSTVYRILNKFEEAHFFAEQSLSNDKEFYPAKFRLGNIYIGTKEFERALLLYKDLQLTHSDDYRIYQNIAIIYEKQGKLEKSIEYLEKAIETQPNPKSYWTRAKILIRLEREIDAFFDLEEAIALDDKEATPYKIRAVLRCDLQNYRGAIQDFEKISNEDILTPYLNFKAGYAYFKLEDYENALLYWLKIKDKSTKLVTEPFIGQCYYKLNKYEDAIEIFNKVSALDKSKEALISEGFSNFYLKKYKNAAPLFAALVKYDESYDETLNSTIKLIEIAEPSYLESFTKNNEVDMFCFGDVYYNGIFQEKVQNYQRAEYYFEKALLLSPNNISVKYHLAKAYLNNNEVEKCNKIVNYIFENKLENIYFRILQADIYKNLKNYNSAKKELHAIINDNNTSVRDLEKAKRKLTELEVENHVNFKFFKNFENNLDIVRTLDNYHPYRGGNNPNFNDFSKSILNLKNGEPSAISFFNNELNHFFNAGSTIMIIPSHDPLKKNSGIKQLANLLVKNYELVDGTHLLNRTVEIPKLATGGSRNLMVHLNSLKVSDVESVKNKNILLFDDVSTSQNSLRAGKKLLEDAGANMVQMFALAQTQH